MAKASELQPGQLILMGQGSTSLIGGQRINNTQTVEVTSVDAFGSRTRIGIRRQDGTTDDIYTDRGSNPEYHTSATPIARGTLAASSTPTSAAADVAAVARLNRARAGVARATAPRGSAPRAASSASAGSTASS